jgi:hypothetical protein
LWYITVSIAVSEVEKLPVRRRRARKSQEIRKSVEVTWKKRVGRIAGGFALAVAADAESMW